MRKILIAGAICFVSTALWAEEGKTTTTNTEQQTTTTPTQDTATAKPATAAETTKAAVQAATVEFQNVLCKNGKAMRKVEVAKGGNIESKVACEVRYQKDAEQKTASNQVLWSSKSNATYCDTKAKEFVQKLGTMGWACEPSKM